MNFKPVHQNLDTSFVNLSALLKYLRRRRFAGLVRVRLNNYEAEIHITDENQLKVREQDHLSGRVSEGEEALQRILIRSREPGGIVNVFQIVNENLKIGNSEFKDAKKTIEVSKKLSVSEQIPVSTSAVSIKPNPVAKPTVKISTEKIKPVMEPQKFEVLAQNLENQTPKPIVSLPEFPFRLSNNVEAKAQQTKIASDQFQTLVKLFAEILETVDKSLAAANLNFVAAFDKVRSEISGDYPFLKSGENIFLYQNGAIKISGQINPNQFKSSLLEAVRRILEKLGANPKFSDVYRATVQNLLSFLRRRKTLCDELLITNNLEKILGVKN